MLSRVILGASLLMIGIAMLGGCAASSAPAGWLPSARETQWDGFGSWAVVTLSIGPDEVCAGELIAATADSIFVLQGGRLEVFAYNQVARIHLQSYDARQGGLAAWTVGGALSTISHGFILIISAPVWIATGTIASVAQSRAPHQTIREGDWRQLAPFCRYPGGIPDSIDRSMILPKQFGFD